MPMSCATSMSWTWLEEGLQVIRRAILDKDSLLLARDLEVDDRNLERGEFELLAEERGIDLGLRQMDGTAVGGDVVEIAAVGLDLLQHSIASLKPSARPRTRSCL